MQKLEIILIFSLLCFSDFLFGNSNLSNIVVKEIDTSQVLFLTIYKTNDNFRVSATLNKNQIQFNTVENIDTIINTFDNIYTALNNPFNGYKRLDRTIKVVKGEVKFKTSFSIKKNDIHRYNYEDEFIADISYLSKIFIEPLNDFVRLSTEIRIQLGQDIIKYPIDLLFFNQKPIFLQKPVSFFIASFISPNKLKIENPKCLIIRDKTADPQNGCDSVNNFFKNAYYFEVEQLQPEKIDTFKLIDILLISSHGGISFTENDYIELNNFKLQPFNFKDLQPKIIYFDACKSGVSYNFVQRFKTNNAFYYLGPISDNEAGNSSTLTMKYFFSFLTNGISPIEALYETRKELFYKFENSADILVVYWYSYLFRIYCF